MAPRLLVTLPLLLLLGCASAPETGPPSRPARAHPVDPPPAASLGPAGIWFQPPAPWDPDAPTIRLPRQPFVYDGEHVTMHLWTAKVWMWRASDDTYRVQTRWQGDVLQWRPPFGPWSDLARFEGDRFVDSDGVPFARTTAGELPEAHRTLLIAREPHDDSITPLGRRSGAPEGR
jgi:hypothetical protein